jgi:hypothetical protein
MVPERNNQDRDLKNSLQKTEFLMAFHTVGEVE